MTQSLYRSLGATTLPATAAGVQDGQLWAQLDPLHAAMLALCSIAVNAEVGEAFSKVIRRFPELFEWSNPVASVYHRSPNRSWLATTYKTWPLMTLARSGQARHIDLGIRKRCREQTWHLHWGMPPLDGDADFALAPMFTAVGAAIEAAIEEGSHPAYTGTRLGDIPGLQEVHVTTVDESVAELPTSVDTFKFQFVEIAIVSRELSRVDGDSLAGRFGGADIIADLGTGAELLPCFAVARI